MESWGEFLENYKKEGELLVKEFLEELKNVRQSGVDLEQIRNINVEAYEGNVLPIYQLATINVKDALTVLISPWDKSIVEKIESSLKNNLSNVRLATKVEGIIVNFPPLTEETLKKVVKQLHGLTESYRQKLRRLRNSYKSKLDEAKNNKELGEELYYKYLEQLDKLTKNLRERIERASTEKENKILSK